MTRLADITDVLVGATSGKEGAPQRYVRLSDISETGIARTWGAEAPEPVKGIESKLRLGDILVRAKGRDLAVGRVGDEHAGAFTTADVFVVRPDVAVCDPAYLVALFRSPSIRAQLASGLQGSGLLRLTRDALTSLEVPLPPRDTQARIGALAMASEAELLLMDQLRMLRAQLHTELLQNALEKAHAEDCHPRRGIATGPADASADGLPIHREKQKAGPT